MSTILIAEIRQETSTFNPHPTYYDMFRQSHGEQIPQDYAGTHTEISGFMDVVAKRDDIRLVFTMSAESVSGGAIPKPDLDRLLDEMLSSIGAAAETHVIDACYMCLHGAMAGAEQPDPEGYLLDGVRERIGNVPLVASIDLHAVLTDRMLQHCDIIVPFHTYPHVDQYPTGRRAAQCLLDLLDGKIQPEMATVPIPMLVRGDELITETGKFGEAIDMCQQIEASEGGIAAGVNIGNAFTDVPQLRSNVLVIRDRDRAQAIQEAEQIAHFMWDHRQLFTAQLMSLEDSITAAEQTTGLTVFSDAADATSSGASGDSNKILQGIIDSSFTGSVLVPIVDAAAVQAACKAGVAQSLTVQLGGTLDPERFKPLSLNVRVKSLHDGNLTYENGVQGFAGRVAVLQHQSIDILVTEQSAHFVGQRIFTSHGLNPADYDIVVIKSPNGFRTYFQDITARICPVDVPGSTSANLKSLPFSHVQRPIFPLDEDVEFHPQGSP